MSEQHERYWVFNLAIESATGQPVAKSVASDLLERITVWAEERDLQVGGGYRRPRPEDEPPGPIFELDEDQATQD